MSGKTMNITNRLIKVIAVVFMKTPRPRAKPPGHARSDLVSVTKHIPAS